MRSYSKPSVPLVSILLAIVVALLMLNACASDPSALEAIYVSPADYKELDCEQLEQEAEQITNKLGDMLETLSKKHGYDMLQATVGLWFWPAFFLLEGGDGPEAEEYQQLQGTYEAITTVAERKCPDLFIRPLEQTLKALRRGELERAEDS